MSQVRYYAPNPGPLKLEHDPPPRVVMETQMLAHREPVYLNDSDARFKGFPERSFESPRIPISQLREEAKLFPGYPEERGINTYTNAAGTNISTSVPPERVLAHWERMYNQFDHRYKGYPGQSFHSPRVPVSQTLDQSNDKDDYQYYEATPRDFRINPISGPAPILIRSDARYKGYPGNSFHSPRIPVSQSPDTLARIAPQEYYGKVQLFEPGKPKLDEGHRGLQYGSSSSRGNIHQPPPAPKPKDLPQSIRAVPFGEDKTPEQIARRRELQQEAEEDILRFKDQQNRRKEREMAEKKKDYEQLKHHFMLDGHKYGGGAPKASGDYRRTKFTDEAPSDSPRYRDPSYGNPDRVLRQPLDIDVQEYMYQKSHPDLFLDEIEKRKNMEPPDSTKAADHMLRAPEIIRFQDQGRKSIENRYRYSQPQHEKEDYRKDLERQQEERELREKSERIEKLRMELEMLKGQNQNKSGGGAPNWSSSDQQLWKPQKPEEVKSLELDKSQGGAGAPIMNSSGKPVTRHPITMKRNDQGESSIRESYNGGGRRQQIWEPESDAFMGFGRPGAGAPIKDSEGRIVTAVYGKLGGDLSSADRRRRTRAARLLRDDLQKEMVEQKKNKDDFNNHMKAPVGDLSSIMMEGKVGKPTRDPVTGNLVNQHLNHSDISRQKQNRPEAVDKTGTKEYHEYLTRQAEERERSKRLNKLREEQEWRQHNDAFDTMFGGRFGGGNRKGQNLKKESLANTLFSPRRDENGQLLYEPTAKNDQASQNPEWMNVTPREVPPKFKEKSYQGDRNEDYSASDVGQRYVKSTISSGSKNMYELPQQGPRNPYAYRTPYALLGNN